jgi:hypothetical protein
MRCRGSAVVGWRGSVISPSTTVRSWHSQRDDVDGRRRLGAPEMRLPSMRLPRTAARANAGAGGGMLGGIGKVAVPALIACCTLSNRIGTPESGVPAGGGPTKSGYVSARTRMVLSRTLLFSHTAPGPSEGSTPMIAASVCPLTAQRWLSQRAARWIRAAGLRSPGAVPPPSCRNTAGHLPACAPRTRCPPCRTRGAHR